MNSLEYIKKEEFEEILDETLKVPGERIFITSCSLDLLGAVISEIRTLIKKKGLERIVIIGESEQPFEIQKMVGNSIRSNSSDYLLYLINNNKQEDLPYGH